MTPMTIAKRFLALLSGLLIAFTAAAPGTTFAQSQFSQRELDQLLAPVALYPDPLLSQVLMAATYPRDVIEAADWSRSHPGLQGDDAVRAVRDEDWDPSVKSLCAFPNLLARMDEKLDWTRDLGDAFLAQEEQVMDTVQQLRQRARAAGNLQSSEELYVQEQGPVISINLASPNYLYVPYYDPMVVYGSWWWPGYRPVVWAPWPGYARRYHAGLSIGFWWGAPIALSANFFYGNFDWHRRQVQVVHVNNYYYRPAVAHRPTAAATGHWQHDPQHRRDVGYRDATVRNRFETARQEHVRDRNERPQAQAPAVTERRVDRREERHEDRRDVREERRPERQAAPAPVQPAAQPRFEQRDDRRSERQAQEAQRHAQQQVQESQRQAQQQQARQAQEAQRQAQQQQARQAQEAQRQAQETQRQHRPEPRPSMPAAQTQQTPHADRQDKTSEHRQERGQERGQKS